ncbi:MAG: XTP/dITP diphosphohydrolase [Actinomycetota bacterium]|nr:XTP/dITP diphosphohydrolase [Actinomycetota bacterium]
MAARLVLATRNAHKVGELQAILTSIGVDVSLVGMDAYPDLPDVVEDGLTFAANASKKARVAAEATGLPAVADDSGLCVDALNGMPGVFSARWAGTHSDDAANLALVLAQISDVPDEHRGGRFECAAALVLASGEERVTQGRIDGVLIREPRGTGGFGYDPAFVPHGYEVTTAEMAPPAKNAISHRGRAFRELAPFIDELVVARQQPGGKR